MFEEIDQKKQTLDQKRPLPVHTLRSIREHLIVNWTYHSNAIEGNTLTLSETKVALEGITIGVKTIIEHLEVINLEHSRHLPQPAEVGDSWVIAPSGAK